MNNHEGDREEIAEFVSVLLEEFLDDAFGGDEDDEDDEDPEDGGDQDLPDDEDPEPGDGGITLPARVPVLWG